MINTACLCLLRVLQSCHWHVKTIRHLINSLVVTHQFEQATLGSTAFLLGGWTETGPTDSVFAYDSLTGTWSQVVRNSII